VVRVAWCGVVGGWLECVLHSWQSLGEKYTNRFEKLEKFVSEAENYKLVNHSYASILMAEDTRAS
jgi:hypothetical protein